jgi:hypothetical protein
VPALGKCAALFAGISSIAEAIAFTNKQGESRQRTGLDFLFFDTSPLHLSLCYEFFF